MKLFESPDHALGVVQIQGLVVVVKVHPASLAGYIGAPVLGVLQNTGLAKLIELCDTKLLNFWAARDSKQALCLNFSRQSMGVPTKSALNSLTAHGLVSRNEVFGVAGE